MPKELPTLEAQPSEEQARAIQVIVEGGYQDDWSRHTQTVIEKIVPENCTRITFIPAYVLILVATWKDDGVHWLEEQEGGETVNFGLVNNFGILRPCTVITEDGRIYHDLELINAPDEVNRKRLTRYLEVLEKEFGRTPKDTIARIRSEITG